MTEANRRGPLAGLKVLDFTHVLSGPFATQQLADLGADVVKIEKPGRGDSTRSTPPFIGEISHYFLAINRGKRSLGVDLKLSEGRELVLKLAERADVSIENFRPGVMSENGLGPEVLAARNPRLIQCAISGFGQTGSLATRPSFDVVTQAMAGTMSVTGEPGGPPLRCGLSIGDLVAGLYAVQAITTALYERERTGKGTVLDVPMYDCLFSFLAYYLPLAQTLGRPPEPAGSSHATVVPMGGFETADGWLVVAAFNQAFWLGLCRAMGRPDLPDDPRYVTMRDRQQHRESLMAELRAVFPTKTRQEWAEILDANGVPNGPVLDVLTLLDHPLVAERHLLQSVSTPGDVTVRVSRQPVLYGGELPEEVPSAPAPAIGEHGDEILRDWLRLSDGDLASLRQAGAIG